MLVVIALIAILAGLLMPVVQSARRRALEAECKNNLHQINLAVVSFQQTMKRLTGPGTPGLVGGWTIDVLPFIEQQNLADQITTGTSIAAAPGFLLGQPTVYHCPIRRIMDEPSAGVMENAHYVFVPLGKRKGFRIFDAPVAFKSPWASGPEMANDVIITQTGPHQGGFYYARGFQQGIAFMLNGQDVP